MEEAVNQHYEGMRQAQGANTPAQDQTPELFPLFTIAGWLWEFLRPAPPNERFRADLHAHLVAEAERRRVQRALQGTRGKRPLQASLVVSVAALGAASLVGAYAYWRRAQHAGGGDTALAA